MLRQETYDAWKEMELVMDARFATPTPPAPLEPVPEGQKPKYDPEKIKALIERWERQKNVAPARP